MRGGGREDGPIFYKNNVMKDEKKEADELSQLKETKDMTTKCNTWSYTESRKIGPGSIDKTGM